MNRILLVITLFASASCLLPASAQKQKVSKTESHITLAKPQIKPATDITPTSFTANWEAVPGAEAYCVYVYTKKTAPQDGVTVITNEDFGGITSGSLLSPLGGDENYVDLSKCGYALSYGWSAYAFPTFIPSMVDGLVYSPYLDLQNDNGKYTIAITTYANKGDSIKVESHGTGEKQVRKYMVNIDNMNGFSTDTLQFCNGSRDLFFSIINVTAKPGTPDYVDEVEVTQKLKKGDVFYNMIAGNEAVEAENDFGQSVASCRFHNVTKYAEGETEVYYDVYAVVHDWTTPNGSMPYTAIYSPYSDKMWVDLKNCQTSIDHIAPNKTTSTDEAWYDLTGRCVEQPGKGFYIHKGKKMIIQ